MSETVESIAARYGAVVRPGLEVQKVEPGKSGLPRLVWDAKKGLVYEVKPNLQRMLFAGGRPSQPCVYRGVQYPSMGAAALACGVSVAAVSKAVKKRLRRQRDDAA